VSSFGSFNFPPAFLVVGTTDFLDFLDFCLPHSASESLLSSGALSNTIAGGIRRCCCLQRLRTRYENVTDFTILPRLRFLFGPPLFLLKLLYRILRQNAGKYKILCYQPHTKRYCKLQQSQVERADCAYHVVKIRARFPGRIRLGVAVPLDLGGWRINRRRW
jgi:hypothetical protein